MEICLKVKEKGVASKVDEQSLEQSESGVFCKACMLYLASPDDRIEVNGSVDHAFANPHGMVFEIGCFARAQGCFPASEPSDEFSWFSGYQWQVALCRGCANHLGWYFSSSSSQFYGLIYEHLVII